MVVDAPSLPVYTTDVYTVCHTKTSLVRHVTESMKRKVYARDGVPGGNNTGKCRGPHGCEVDHRIPLGLGGSNDLSNLMIQPYFGACSASHKDVLENVLHNKVCNGEVELPAAQSMSYNNWEDAYRLYVDPKGCAAPLQ